MFTQRGEGRGGGADQLQNVKGRGGTQGRRGGNQEDKNQGTCLRAIRTREAESRDGGDY
jgi:hypothetical protein